MKYVSVAVYVCRLLDEERQHHKDIVSNNEVIDDLRAALDVERSNALELESRFKQEQERSKQVRTELENSNLQLNVQQTLAAELQQKVDELTDESRRVTAELKSSLSALTIAKEESVRLQTTLNSTRAEDRQLLDDVSQRADRLESLLKTERAKVEQLELRLTENEQKMRKTDAAKEQQVTSVDDEATLLVERKQLESARQRLCLAAMQLQDQLSIVTASVQSDAAPARHRMMGDMAGTEPHHLQELLSDLQRLLSELASLQLNLNADWMGSSGQTLSSAVPALNDAILRHNADLTSYIERLTAEKQDLRVVIASLQQKSTTDKQQSQADSTVSKLAAERTHLNQELANTVRQLGDARTEVSRLTAELRRVESELERERERCVTPSGDGRNEISRAKTNDALTLVDLENEIQRLYSKYLRAESFRKSLIYQKKYLLLLIGGFQDGEQETLAMISRMGAFPSCNDLHERRIQPISRFRTAARVIIAISRLKFVSKRWQRASRGTSSTQAHLDFAGDSEITHRAPVLSTRPVAVSTRSLDHAYLPANSHQSVLTANVASRQFRSMVAVPTTPPTRDRAAAADHHSTDRLLAHAASTYRTPVYLESSSSTAALQRMPSGVGETNGSKNEYLRRLESLQAKLGGSVAAGYIRR